MGVTSDPDDGGLGVVLEEGPLRGGGRLRGRVQAGEQDDVTLVLGWRLASAAWDMRSERNVSEVHLGGERTFDIALPLLPPNWEGRHLRATSTLLLRACAPGEAKPREVSQELAVAPGDGPEGPAWDERNRADAIASDHALSEGLSIFGMSIVGGWMLVVALLLASAPVIDALDALASGQPLPLRTLGGSLLGTAVGAPAAWFIGGRLHLMVLQPLRERRARHGSLDQRAVRLGASLGATVRCPAEWSLVRIEGIRTRRLETWSTTVAHGRAGPGRFAVPIPADGPASLGDVDVHVVWELRLLADGVAQRLPFTVLPWRAPA
jgi:hypothetical protein